ncbi:MULTISPECIES: hypothetical protein [unclassified Streptomyces]|uniref:hypothetical protein n=1 Tax=unclassified Streptomyces TaxID=2593676 RepID=UPI0004C7DC10|nr:MULTISPECIES: hypothetical protein [unclassified Streptomyces]KJY18946.1 hypothetical protein VR43_22525 [Streptomyces sp. NRRL S-104]
MIDVGKIPTFTGNLETLETHAAALKTTASSIRGTGRDVHNAFQALDPVYDAPEQEELLNSTIPVRDNADAFATKLESVSGALTNFATTARPLVDRMKQLRIDAEKFVADNKDDEDWQQDQGKIDENARLVREVGVTWVAFQGVERDAANKITTLVGGTHFVVDDGSHKAGMYGFRESDVKDARETPWGTADEREYTGLRAAWEWTKDKVGSGLKGFFVDGVWGTLKGLGNMVNVFDLDTLKKTWSGIGDVFEGVSGYLLTPWDWAMDKMLGPADHTDREKNKAALRNFGKSLVAWDEWGKDPARAGGTVVFNVLTIGAGSFLKLGRAGKLGVGSEIATVVGKAGVLVDPMSYLGKAANVTKIKVGDFMEGLKASRAGVDDMARNMPGGTSPHPAEATAPPPGHEYVDPNGNKRVIGHDGAIRDEHGNVVPDTEPVREPHKDDLPNTHEPAPAKERVLEGAGGPSHAENSTGHPTGPAHPAGGSHAPGGATNHSVGGAASHTSGGAGHNTAHNSPTTSGGGGAGTHGGTAPHTTGGGTATHGDTATTGGDGSGGSSGGTHHGDGSGVPHQGDGSGHDASGNSGDGGGQGDAPDASPGGAGDPPLDPKVVDERIKELDDRQGGEGHAPGRHLYPADQALIDRLGTVLRDANGAPKLYGPNSHYPGLVKSENNIDPLTGSTVDGVHGGVHRVGPYATRFGNAEDMVRADEYFRAEYARTGEMPKDTSIADVLGAKAHERFTGYYRDPSNLTDFKPVDFEGGTIVPGYRIHDGKLTLHTMFANPAPGRHP